MRVNVHFVFQAEDGIRGTSVTGVQTCALPIYRGRAAPRPARRAQALPSRLGHRERGTASGLGEGREDGLFSVRKDAGAGVERAGLTTNSMKDQVMTRKIMLAIGIVSVPLVVLIGTAISAQDKYSLKTS